MIEVTRGDSSVTGRVGTDLRPFDFSDDGEIEAEVVFAGYGIHAPELDYDDFDGLDVEGKLVFVLRHEPGERDSTSSFDGTDSSTHAYFTAKAEAARSRGAAGMILATDPLNHETGGSLRASGALSLDPPEQEAAPDDTTGAASGPFLAVHVSWTIADALMAASGRRLVDVQRDLDDGSIRAVDVPLGDTRARITVKRLEEAEAVEVQNVAGYLEGSDPILRDELVVVGAHHDHLGGTPGEGDAIYNGADDNASGTAGVLAIARAFAGGEARPRRSVVFTTFSGEERGLLGSKAMVRDGQVPIDRVVFMLNMDMIGRNPEEPLTIIGDGFARGMREAVERANAGIDLDLEYMGTGYAGNSDHDSFYRRDIPFIMFFTGLHDDYHQLGDHADKLAFERMTDIVRLGAALTAEMATAEHVPHFIHRIAWLGIEVEVLGADDSPEAVVTDVAPDSRAAAAGFAEGDVLTAFGAEALASAADVGEAFRAISPGSETAITVRRQGARVSLDVERARTGFLGIGPGEVEEDVRAELGLSPNEGVLVRRLVPDGPSDRAGLRAGDILLSIAGRPVTTGTLGEVLSQIGAGEPVDVRLVRDGERMTLPLTLGERPRRG
jgi:hypothetical protein